MSLPEILGRTKTAARVAVDRGRFAITHPRWDRRDLAGRLTSDPQLDDARAALAHSRWWDANDLLARHFHSSARFVIAPRHKAALVERISREFPDGSAAAAARADRIVAGEYDLLGYRGLRFDGETAIDWQYDPVHDRRPARLFWADVPYLDPASGDHKVIWELNRHQHWLTLGRAYWLTGHARYRETFERELTSWLDQNPPLAGVNWASMLELALRSLSWLWAIHFFVDDRRDPTPDRGEGGSPWLVDLLVALDRQLTHVEQNLSYYFSPNTHLLGEALALYVVGRTLPQLAASARREQTGRDILVAEIERQICADGGHAERSTHYHRYALDFYTLALAIARNTGDTAAGRFEGAVVRLGAAARLLADGRGRIPHIGDDDGGALLPMTGRATDDFRDSLAIAAALVRRPDFQVGDTAEEALWMVGAQSGISNQQPASSCVASAALRDTGYYVSRSQAGDHLIIDGGPHGYQNAGHAHADALSLTLAVGGVPLLIDPGTGSYTFDGVLRDRLRSTALHNTLALDDHPQSVPDGPFHWAHVANGRVHAWRTNDAFDYFDGAHDGYRPVEHRRRVLSLHGDLVVVGDLVHGGAASCVHVAAVHWHLDRRWNVDIHSRGATLTDREADERGGQTRVGLSVPQGVVESFVADEETGLGWCSPEYGRIEPATTVRISQSGAVPFWMVTVFDFDPNNPVSEVEWMPVWAEAGTIAHAVAIRITREVSIDHVLVAAATDDELKAGPVESRDNQPFSPPSAIAPVTRAGTWRVGEFETDARMLFWRTAPDGRVERLAMVDGSTVRAAGRRNFEVALPRVASDFHLDSRIKDQSPCAGSPAS